MSTKAPCGQVQESAVAVRRSSHLSATLSRNTSDDESEEREEMARHPRPGRLNHPVAEGLCQLAQGARDKIIRCHIDCLWS